MYWLYRDVAQRAAPQLCLSILTLPPLENGYAILPNRCRLESALRSGFASERRLWRIQRGRKGAAVEMRRRK